MKHLIVIVTGNDEESCANMTFIDTHRRILGGARRGNAPPKVPFAPPSFS